MFSSSNVDKFLYVECQFAYVDPIVIVSSNRKDMVQSELIHCTLAKGTIH